MQERENKQMVDMRFSILDTEYHLTSDDRQYILYTVTSSSAKDSLDGIRLANPKYFGRLAYVWAYIERVTPLKTGEVLSSLRDLDRVNEVAGGLIEAVSKEVSEND